jgi:putative oxidoreductase
MKLIVLLGRILYSAIFISGGLDNLTNAKAVAYAASAGVPMPSILVPLAGVLALLGGLSILFGYKAKWGAWMIVAFLIPVTFMMHAFWTVTDPQMQMMQTINFSKNLSMLGGAFLITYFGAGPLSMEKMGPMEGKTVRVGEPVMRKAA